MKLLITSDIHYNLKQYDWILARTPEYDAVVIAGDLLDLAGHVELDAQAGVVERYLLRMRDIVPTIVSSGNHDTDTECPDDEFACDWLEVLHEPRLTTDGYTAHLDGLAITACPWHNGPVTKDRVLNALTQGAAHHDSAWAWLYHAPPQGSPLAWSGKKDFGDPLLNELIEEYRPDYVFCGHIHNAPYRDGGSWIHRVGSAWCFNPGFQMASQPCAIELDTRERKVRWLSDFDFQEVELDR